MTHINRSAFFLALLLSSLSMYASRGPKLVSPINNSIEKTTAVTLSWEPLSKTQVIYEIKVSQSSIFDEKDCLTFETSNNYLVINYPFFEPGKKYYWTVRGKYLKSTNAYTITDWSHERQKNKAEYSFNIDQNAMDISGEQPKISFPILNSAIDTLQPTIRWSFNDLSEEPYKILDKDNKYVNPSYSDISFELQISSSEDFSVGTKTFGPIFNDSMMVTLPILLPNNKYFLRVRASYYNPITKKTTTTLWSDNYTQDNSFSTSKESIGQYTFSEGSILEEYDKGRLNYSLEMFVTNENNSFSPSISMNGEMLAFISDRTGKNELYLKRVEGRRSGGETQKTNIMANRSIHNPFWLHDDERVAFFANIYKPSSWHLFSSNKGSGLTIMTSGMEMAENNSEFCLSGSCSTDGRIIFAAKMHDGDPYMLYLLDVTDDSRTQLRQGLFPDIRDDDKIVFCSDETGNYEIWVVELEGRSVFKPTILNSHPADDYEPAFSPGGDKILFTSNRSGNSDIWMMDYDGSNLQQLTFHPMVDRRPQWIDSSTIVFQSNRSKNKNDENVYSIYLLRLNN